MEFSRDKYLERIIDKEKNSLIKVITGTRRCGKSYFMNKIFYNHLLSTGVAKECIIKFAFDNDENIDLLEKYYQEEPTKIYDKNGLYTINSKKFRAYIKDITNDNNNYYLLLDEIQILDSFVGTLNGFLNHSNFDVYVTGSNSQLLSSEIETKFRGRKSSIHMLPLTFYEFLTGINLPIDQAWKKYIVTGGIPLVYTISENDKIDFLNELCKEVYIKDIVGRNNLKDETTLNELFNMLASFIGSGVNPSKLERAFKSERHIAITDDTINNYINHFADAFVISKVKKYNIKGKKYINTPFKIYFEDIGIRNAATSFVQIEETHIMENIIYNELRYRGYMVMVGTVDVNEMTDRKDCNGKTIYKSKELEIDFIATKGDRCYYIQSCLDINNEETLKREKKSLYYVNDSFKKIIITKDGLDVRRDQNGFVIMDLFDFLLKENSLEL